jgi:hypothetical protein
MDLLMYIDVKYESFVFWFFLLMTGSFSFFMVIVGAWAWKRGFLA